MREILFRGKRIDNGEWVYGYYVFRRKRRGAFGQTITELDFDTHYIVSIRGESFEVDPSSVGQYTGLTDKNGKEIFEGDIVRDNNGQTYEMVFIEKYNCYYFVYKSSVYAGIKPKDIEVIGNIHDNPELLEVEE